ncbi:MAG: hypothetical protein H7338_15855 [Candidatus Sericytochromatia bacterium]|nr:hypothetical protein [Candidatus Sericytochromatia bacterium]
MSGETLELGPGVMANVITTSQGLLPLQQRGPFPGTILTSAGQGRYHVLRFDKTVERFLSTQKSNRLERQLVELGLQFGVGDEAKLATVATRLIDGTGLTTLLGEVYDLPDDRVSQGLREAFLGHNHIAGTHVPAGAVISLFGTPIGLQVARIHLRRLLDDGDVASEAIEEALSWIAYQLAEPDRRTAALILRHQRRDRYSREL